MILLYVFLAVTSLYVLCICLYIFKEVPWLFFVVAFIMVMVWVYLGAKF